MLPQRHRLRHGAELARLRRTGMSCRNALAVFLWTPNGLQHSRFAFAAGKRIGTSVTRNRSKRLLREAVRLELTNIKGGWDCLLIARNGMGEAEFHQVQSAIRELLARSDLLREGLHQEGAPPGGHHS